jgi:hypothetical protein
VHASLINSLVEYMEVHKGFVSEGGRSLTQQAAACRGEVVDLCRIGRGA